MRVECDGAPDHILRRIDRFLEMAELRDALAVHYSAKGRPSIAHELLIRRALLGRLYASTSERRMCEEVRYNLPIREQRIEIRCLRDTCPYY